MAVTQKQLAEKVGVSQMTVSRALRGDPAVKEELRNCIRAAALDIGYSLESGFDARALRQRGLSGSVDTRIVSVLMDGVDDVDQADFHARIRAGIRQGCRELDYESIIAERYCDRMPLIIQRRQVDGVVRLISDLELINGLLPCPLPWVSVLRDVSAADAVVIDDHAAGAELGRQLGRRGHCRCAFIGPDNELAAKRLSGIRHGLSETGGSVPEDWQCLERGLSASPDLNRVLTALMERYWSAASDARFSTIFVYNDHMAVQVIRTLYDMGVRVPVDLSIVGFDGATPVGFRDIELTTIALPLEELGAEAVRVLAWRLTAPMAARRVLSLSAAWVPGTTLAPKVGA